MLKKNPFLLFVLLWVGLSGAAQAAGPKNLILFIGDGMGPQQVAAAGMFANGRAGSLSFESFPYRVEVTTYSADSNITDSAAAATAIATGRKVNNGVLSVAVPGDGQPLFTLLEYFKINDKSTGLVTTTFMTHATPAAFAAHQPSRGNLPQIADNYFRNSRPTVLFGGGHDDFNPAKAKAAGYMVVTNLAELQNINTETARMVTGVFGNGHLPFEVDGLGELPHLSQMVDMALKILADDPEGFFLMVEGGRIDHAGHNNDILRNIHETLEFDRTVARAVNWARDRKDTLVLVTADHETGGLKVLKNNGKDTPPQVSWSTKEHTDTMVGLYGWGVNAKLLKHAKDNTDIFAIATTDTPFFVMFSRGQAVAVVIVALMLAALIIKLISQRDKQAPQ
ncbi:MAG: alkaline phosphatase [Planctomycetota bacterium]